MYCADFGQNIINKTRNVSIKPYQTVNLVFPGPTGQKLPDDDRGRHEP